MNKTKNSIEQITFFPLQILYNFRYKHLKKTFSFFVLVSTDAKDAKEIQYCFYYFAFTVK